MLRPLSVFSLLAILFVAVPAHAREVLGGSTVEEEEPVPARPAAPPRARPAEPPVARRAPALPPAEAPFRDPGPPSRGPHAVDRAPLLPDGRTFTTALWWHLFGGAVLGAWGACVGAVFGLVPGGLVGLGVGVVVAAAVSGGPQADAFGVTGPALGMTGTLAGLVAGVLLGSVVLAVAAGISGSWLMGVFGVMVDTFKRTWEPSQPSE